MSADGTEFLRHLRNDIADVVFLDPPFHLGKDYGAANGLERAADDEYEEYFAPLLSEAIRVVRPGGALFLYHLPRWAWRFAAILEKGLDFRHWVAISMKNGFVRGDYLYPAHYALLYFTKGRPAVFHRPKIHPRTCHECGEPVKDYGGYWHIIDAKGINLSDVWDDLSPVRHRNTRLRKANQLPVLLTDRVVQIAGREGGVLVDAFAGTGTAILSAFKRQMTFIGNDLDPSALDIAESRIRDEAMNLRKARCKSG